MYHTEGFVNKYTIDAKKHIITLALEREGRPWYVWCITKKAVVETDVFRQVLSFWLQQTLLTQGKKWKAYARRELNRLGGYLEHIKGLSVEVEDIHLIMLYEGEFYHWHNENRGFTDDVLELSDGLFGYVSEEGFLRTYQKEDFQMESTVNKLELSLLEACKDGKLEEGFFLIWEDGNAL